MVRLAQEQVVTLNGVTVAERVAKRLLAIWLQDDAS
jgi:hypothetical protein